MNNALRLQATQIGGYTRRWHAEDTIGDGQTVGHHTWGMLAIYLLLCREPDLDVVRLITFHDAPEPFSGDIPWFARKACPAAAEADAEISRRWFAAVTPGGDPGIFAPQEIWWLKMLDAAEAYFYAKRQVAMGNRLMEEPCLALVSRLEAARQDEAAPEYAWDVVQDIFGTKISKRLTRDISELETL